MIAEKLREWYRNPVKFVIDCFNAEPTAQQVELLSSVGSGEDNAFAVRSGHGCGKSSALAWLILWFLLTRPQSKIVCTAPTKRQLKDILWSEVSLWYSRAIPVVREMIEVMSEKIKVKGREDWWARAVSINVQASPEEQAESLAGYHAKHFLAVIDEASGVPDPVFLPIEGYLTQKTNYVIMTSNPTRTEGYFYKVFNDEAFGEDWNKFHWNSELSPLVSSNWIERMKKRYGEDSDTYRVRVKGEFPLVGEQTLIPMSWIQRNIVSSSEIAFQPPFIWSIDPAGMGGDETSLIKQAGTYVYYSNGKAVMDEDGIIDFIQREYAQDEHKPQHFIVDCTGGYGSAIAQRLRKLFKNKVSVHEIFYSWKSTMPENFVQLRDELYWRLRLKFEFNLIKIIDDPKLIRQLSSIKYTETDKGKVKIEPKSKIRKRIGSPDRADACAQATYLDNLIMSYDRRTVSSYKRRRRRRYVASWLVA